MTSLALTLDNVDISENSEQISKLFPKCRPRSDINLNPITSTTTTISSEHENEIIDDNIIISTTIMNIDSDNDR